MIRLEGGYRQMPSEDEIPCICLMGDVIASRKEEKHKQLKKMVSILNKQLEEALLTDFTIRSGDEIFGNISNFPDGYRALKEMLRLSNELDVPLCIGVGMGFILNNDLMNPHEVNGQAIWDAADALHILKNEKPHSSKGMQATKTFKFYFHSSVGIPYEVVNYHVYFLFERIVKRTDKQKEAVETVDKWAASHSYEEMGTILGYDKYPATNLSKMLARAEFHLVAEAEKGLCDLLKYFQQQIQEKGGKFS